mmetsp:Transcript_6684/g.18763  ORF Transcript_6684/g.18763 Transcript_6684/m.18763 type:complete len:333 (+) Transcript_6684:689-1687(+)
MVWKASRLASTAVSPLELMAYLSANIEYIRSVKADLPPREISTRSYASCRQTTSGNCNSANSSTSFVYLPTSVVKCSRSWNDRCSRMISPHDSDEGYILLSASKHIASKINNPATASPNDTAYFFARFAQAAQSWSDVECNQRSQAPKNCWTESSSTLASNLRRFSGISRGAGRPTRSDAKLQALKSMGQSRVTLSKACSHVASFNREVTTLSVLRGSDAIWAYAASTARSSPWQEAGPASAKQAFAFAKRWPHCSPSSVKSPRISNSNELVLRPPTFNVQTVKTGDSSSGRPSSDLASASMAGVWGCLGAARALPGRACVHGRVDGVWAGS